MFHKTQEERAQIHDRINHHLKELFQIEDTRGIELFYSLTRIGQLFEMIASQQFNEQEISVSRWRIMLFLFMAEQLGNSDGVTPTELSHVQQVSKNTISALLRGLEEQGYIQREMDSKDLRVFRIRLTEAGRQIIFSTAPKRIESQNQILASLSDDEIQQLSALLAKLQSSLESQFCKVHKG